jgi:hypothetical protein
MPEREQSTRSVFFRFLGFWTEERSLTFMLLLLAIHFFVVTPATFLGHAFNVIGSLLFSLALLVGLLALVKKRIIRWLATLLVAGAVLFRIAALFSEAPWLIIVNTLFTILALSALVLVVFLQVSREGPVTAHRIRGAIALYLLIAMLFAFLYGIIEILAPGAFNMPAGLSRAVVSRAETFYYFSIVTLTTVGFGDITAVHPFVRSLVMLEALIGQLYPAVLLARLVSLEIETRKSRTGIDR